MRLCGTCSVVFCCYLVASGSASLTMPNLTLTESCPNSYSITEASHPDLVVKAIHDTNACRFIQERREEGKHQQIIATLRPKIQPVFGNENLLNISWSSSVGRGRKHRTYLLQLIKYEKDGEDFKTSRSCLHLQLKNKGIKNIKSRITLFFDCIRLVPEPHTFLGVKIWRLSRKKAVENACITRHKRSLPVSKTCQKAIGGIECSEERMFPLSLDSYRSWICHCSDTPNLSMVLLTNSSFRVYVWNIPQYTLKTEIKIYKEKRHELDYRIELGQTMKENENRSVVTEKAFDPGNYTLEVYTECLPDKEPTLHNCPSMDQVQLNESIEVPYPVVVDTEDWVILSTLAGILAAVIIAAVVIVILFCIIYARRRRRLQSKNKNDQTFEMVLLRPATHSNAEAEVWTPNPRLAVPLRNNETETRYSSELSLERVLSDTEMDVLELAKRKPQKMLLFHPDNQYHECAVQELCKLLQVTCDIHLVDSATNWRDFAESAGKDFTEIIFIVSQGLLRVCKAYRDERVDRETFDDLIQERRYEYAPCVVLHKLQIFIQDSPDSCRFSLHLVSFRSDNYLVEVFLNEFDFLKRYSYCYKYNLCLKENIENEEKETVKPDRKSLKELILRLRGISKHDTQYLEVNEIVLNGKFGQSFFQTLLQVC